MDNSLLVAKDINHKYYCSSEEENHEEIFNKNDCNNVELDFTDKWY